MAEGAENSTSAPPKAAGGSKLVPILLVVNLLLVAAVLAVFLLRGGGGHAAEKPKDGEHGAEAAHDAGEVAGAAAPGPTVKLADFVVHLRDPEADRYARVSFEIEVGTEEDKNKIGGFMPKIRDAFIAYLSDRTLEELRGSEQMGRTKAALAGRLGELAPGVKVRGLYVTDLVIQ
jgi:flagellar FliL protein